ncbi:unnamed protein product [Sphacelaria rigidula]
MKKVSHTHRHGPIFHAPSFCGTPAWVLCRRSTHNQHGYSLPRSCFASLWFSILSLSWNSSPHSGHGILFDFLFFPRCLSFT